MSAPVTYWHKDGEIFVHRLPRPEVISRESALDLLEQHHNAITAGRDARSQQAMFDQLNAALKAQADGPAS